MTRKDACILEIEIKAYCDDLIDAGKAIKGLGGIYAGTLHETDTYFNHPVRDFNVTDEALRIRREGKSAKLTYKGPKLSGRSKTRHEKELVLPDGDSMEEVLLLLGFTKAGVVSKTRELYKLDDVAICLDEVDGLGSFIELEILGTDKEAGEDKLFELAARFGLERFEKKSYLELHLNRKSRG